MFKGPISQIMFIIPGSGEPGDLFYRFVLFIFFNLEEEGAKN